MAHSKTNTVTFQSLGLRTKNEPKDTHALCSVPRGCDLPCEQKEQRPITQTDGSSKKKRKGS